MIKLTALALITTGALFGIAAALYIIWHFESKKPDYQKPRTYEREPESEYQNLIDEHTKL